MNTSLLTAILTLAAAPSGADQPSDRADLTAERAIERGPREGGGQGRSEIALFLGRYGFDRTAGALLKYRWRLGRLMFCEGSFGLAGGYDVFGIAAWGQGQLGGALGVGGGAASPFYASVGLGSGVGVVVFERELYPMFDTHARLAVGVEVPRRGKLPLSLELGVTGAMKHLSGGRFATGGVQVLASLPLGG